ncbi:uncharacterized protein LOC133034368 [Cannabis sativa]|uniref:uncharacterized protein LOC133034368 n=1 Tax=Cannabis sativa TaxID=3483 RepID=UPI0029CA0A62|nr:uncharacterized protein LOC133034368 [Cannabis sativa]
MDGTYNSLLTVVYGFNDRKDRIELWKDLMQLKTDERWILMGDFNAITTKEERVGHRVKYYEEVEFIDCIQSCQLEDIKATGCFFTWTNKQQGQDRIFSKIDRVMANQRWLDAYPNAEALFLKEGIYDHSPGILSLFPKWKCGKKPFKYFRMWKSHPEYDGRVNAVWKQEINGTSMYQIVQKLKILKNVFREINQKGFSNLLAVLTQAKQSLDEAQNNLHADPLNEELQQQELVTRNSFLSAQQHYSSFLQQKAKINWLKDGDSNTALFHASIKQRHR